MHLFVACASASALAKEQHWVLQGYHQLPPFGLFSRVLVRFSGFTRLFRCVMKPQVKLLNCWGEVSIRVSQLSYSQLAGTEMSKCWGWGNVSCCGAAINWNRAELGLRLMNEEKMGKRRPVSPPCSCSRSYWQLWRISILKNMSMTCLQCVWWWFQEKWEAHLTFLCKMRSHHTHVQKEKAVVGKLLPWVRKSELKCNYSASFPILQFWVFQPPYCYSMHVSLPYAY